MSSRPVKRIDFSARARLLQIAKREGRDFNLVLNRYYQERFLARLAASPYRTHFLLKGALFLFARASDEQRQLARSTRDIDLRGEAISNDPDRLRDVFIAVCAQPMNDGVVFHAAATVTERIAEDAAYPGVRVTIPILFAGARSDIQIDIGFGDVVMPGPQQMVFPTLLDDMSIPIVLAYSVETVVAEKFEAMIKLSLLNSRMKDFYDLYQLARTEAFAGAVLQEAVRRTFARRGTTFVSGPAILEESFGTDKARQVRWSAFLRRDRLTLVPAAFAAVVAVLRAFLGPLHTACRQNQSLVQSWSPDDLHWI